MPIKLSLAAACTHCVEADAREVVRVSDVGRDMEIVFLWKCAYLACLAIFSTVNLLLISFQIMFQSLYLLKLDALFAVQCSLPSKYCDLKSFSSVHFYQKCPNIVHMIHILTQGNFSKALHTKLKTVCNQNGIFLLKTHMREGHKI
jgi:hypothetical protein